MAKITGYECDRCKRREPRDGRWIHVKSLFVCAGEPSVVRGGMVNVAVKASQIEISNKHFCGVECLAAYLPDKIAELNAQKMNLADGREDEWS